MDRRAFIHRVSCRSGLGIEETDRALSAMLAELCTAAARRQRIDFGELGHFEADPAGACARFVPGGGAVERYGWQRRRA